MTNTHRKTTTNRNTARIAAVGAFGIGAAIALPGIASAQESPGSLESVANAIPSESAIDTGVAADLGSLTFNLDLGAGASAPGSVSFGSLGVSPNTGSDVVDNGSGEGSSLPGSSDDADDEQDEETSGSLDTGSLGGDSGSLPGSSEEPADGEDDEDPTADSGSLDLGSLPGSSDDEADPEAPADDSGSLDLGSLPGSSDDEAEEGDNGGDTGNDEEAADGSLQFGSLIEILAGLSAGSGDDAAEDAEA